MKTIKIVLGLIGMVAVPLFSQSEEWEWISPIPQGNELYDICVINDSTVIATGDLGTVVRTNNKGDDWEVQHHAGYSNRALWAVDFVDEQHGWIVGEDGLILSSVDGGKIWQPQVSNIQTHLYDVCFADSLNGWSVGRWGKVLHTTDGGKQWAEDDLATLRALHAIHFYENNLGVIVGSGGTLLRSTDMGASWEPIDTGNSSNFKNVAFCSDSVGLVVGEAGCVIKTQNGGVTWQELQTGYDVDFYNVVWTSDSTALIAGYETQSQAGSIYRQNSVVLKTTDAGTSWTPLGDGEPLPIINAVSKSGNAIWGVGENGSLLLTEDGGESLEFKNVTISPAFWQVHFFDSMLGWAVGGRWIARTEDGGSTWQSVTLDSAYFLHTVQFVTPDTGWAAGGTYVFENNQPRLVGELYKSTDGGLTWKKQQVDGLTRILNINFTNSKLGCMSGDEGALYKTTDGGATWEKLNARTRGFIFDAHFINDSTGIFCGEGRIARTIDGGAQWSTAYSASNNVFFSMQFVDSNTAYATGAGGLVVRSTDGGETWQELYSGVYNELWSVYFLTPRVGWAVGTEGLILKTLDYGQSWQRVSTVTTEWLTGIVVNPNGVGFIVGDMGTMLRTEGGLTRIAESDIQTVRQCGLQQNYPNPFNATTTIAYQLSQPGEVLLNVYNLRGQLVKTLVNERQQTGSYSVLLDAESLSSGVYFYALKVNEQIWTRKFVLQK